MIWERSVDWIEANAKSDVLNRDVGEDDPLEVGDELFVRHPKLGHPLRIRIIDRHDKKQTLFIQEAPEKTLEELLR